LLVDILPTLAQWVFGEDFSARHLCLSFQIQGLCC
jgi:hypothetical protein